MSAPAAIVRADPIAPAVRARADRLAESFAQAQPFRHVAIDGFLDDAFCRGLLNEFPAFEARHALNEYGEVGGKAVRMDVRDIGDTYRALDTFLQTPDFLGLISRITGIPDLLYDADYVGGGTHENVHGQALDPHVDFNFHPGTRWHRRLNLIVYLNDEWSPSWGGCLQLHSDPWDTQGNRSSEQVPLFNRCVIFETNEVSWHGFPRIELPADRRTLTRKSFAIYLYTRERPTTETAPSHATVYVPDARPAGIDVGTTLTAAHVAALDGNFANLRNQMRYLYQREQDFARQIGDLEHALAEARSSQRVPLQGFATQPGPVAGLWPDGWAAREFAFAFVPTVATTALELDVWVPSQLGADQVLHTRADDRSSDVSVPAGGRRVLSFALRAKPGDRVEIHIAAGATWSPASDGQSGDTRELAWRLIGATLRHR